MLAHEAEDIAHRLATSWPRSNVAVETWIEQLADLDRPRADQAMRQLVRTAEHPPSIAQFFAVYRGLLGTAHSGSNEPDCGACHDNGWITCTDHPHHHGHWTGREDQRPVTRDQAGDEYCSCGVVRPCRCRAGERVIVNWYRRGVAA